jgi:hypothetical protein
MTWSAFWPGLAAVSGSGVWWQPRCKALGPSQEQASDGGGVAPRDRLLALARHPSFTSAVAGRAARELRWEDLVDVWSATGRLLAGPTDPRHVMGYVRVRAAVLDELERRNVRRFDRWYVRQWESLAHQPRF